MNFQRAVLRLIDALLATVMACFSFCALALAAVVLSLLRGRPHPMPVHPRMVYLGYTSLDQARGKGLLRTALSARMTYNPGALLQAVTVFVPFGKRNHVTQLSDDIVFVERAEVPWPAFGITQKVLRVFKGCWEVRRCALSHDVVMVGGPHFVSVPALFARLTTRARFVLFVEAFWEDILPLQDYMSSVERKFWYFWYALLYRAFDAYIGGPSYKPDFYVGRGMCRERIWPYIHQINAAALETDSAEAELPLLLRDLPHPLVLSIGRLEKEKLSVDCVAMAASLAATGTDFHMIIIGDGAEREALEAEIARIGLGGKVLLLGSQPNAVTYAIAKCADACFAPYMGTALVEVLLAGCAVVAYDNDPHRGIAGDGPVIFVPHGAVAAGAEAMAALLGNMPALAKRRKASRDYAWAKWNDRAIGEAFVAPIVGRR